MSLLQPKMNNTLVCVQQKIGYRFKDVKLLQSALTHSSYAHENNVTSNERMEFLGDSILNFIVAEKLYQDGSSEGDMTVLRSKIVSRTPLALAVERLGLMDFLLLGAGAEKEERLSEKFKSNVFEAIIGAIYLDSRDLNNCRQFIYANLNFNPCSHSDFKSKLQEYVQGRKLGEIVYKEKEVEKSAVPTFFSQVFIGGVKAGEGWGGKKKEAQKNAAEAALKFLTRSNGK